MISKKHCSLTLRKTTEGHKVFVEDHSSNGSFLNGELLIREKVMNDGDELSLVTPK
jgi:pSer/pThr/pTyr-binding forkhead associated (FHA) protein